MTTEKMSYAYLFKYIIIGDTGKYASSIWQEQKGCYQVTQRRGDLCCQLMTQQVMIIICYRCGKVMSASSVY